MVARADASNVIAKAFRPARRIVRSRVVWQCIVSVSVLRMPPRYENRGFPKRSSNVWRSKKKGHLVVSAVSVYVSFFFRKLFKWQNVGFNAKKQMSGKISSVEDIERNAPESQAPKGKKWNVKSVDKRKKKKENRSAVKISRPIKGGRDRGF